MVQPHVVGGRYPASPDGLAALRLAVSLARDPIPGAGYEHIAYRSIPTPRSATRSATPVGTLQRDPVQEEHEAPPRIPSPSPPAEPTSQQSTILSAVRRAQEGDGEAFGELYDAYVDLVHRYISHRVGNHALAEDLTSETFLRALRRIGTFTWQGRDFGA
ncbi:MAG: sigma factor, partial [Mycobacteriales bacterium]